MKPERRIPHQKFENAARELAVILLDATGKYKGNPAIDIWGLYERDKDNFTVAEQVIMRQIINRAVFLYTDLANLSDAVSGMGGMPDWSDDLENFDW
jgi:hypothetical protein